MCRSIGSIVAAAALLLGVACTSASENDDKEPIVVPDDARGVIDAAVDALDEVDSYRASYTIPLPADDARGDAAWEVQYDAPDSYRFLLAPEGDEGQVAESLLVGDSTYQRTCDDVDQGCDDWQQQSRPDLPLYGPSPTFMPGWPAVVLDMMEVDGESQTDDDGMLRVSGTVNVLRAVFENQRRLGGTTFGKSCSSQATPGGGTGEEVCRELSFEEALEQEDDVAFEDENPSEVVVWVSTSDLLPRRIEITQSPRPGETEAGTFVIEYTDFNEIEIEAP